MSTNNTSPKRLLTTPDLCDYLQVSPNLVYSWRYQGIGPKAIKVGGSLRWRLSDVEAWLDLRTSAQSEAG